MHELAERGEPIDLLTLSQRCRTRGCLNAAAAGATWPNLSARRRRQQLLALCRVSLAQVLMRSLIDAAYNIGELAYDEARDTMEVLDEAEKSIYAIGDACGA